MLFENPLCKWPRPVCHSPSSLPPPPFRFSFRLSALLWQHVSTVLPNCRCPEAMISPLIRLSHCVIPSFKTCETCQHNEAVRRSSQAGFCGAGKQQTSLSPSSFLLSTICFSPVNIPGEVAILIIWEMKLVQCQKCKIHRDYSDLFKYFNYCVMSSAPKTLWEWSVNIKPELLKLWFNPFNWSGALNRFIVEAHFWQENKKQKKLWKVKNYEAMQSQIY